LSVQGRREKLKTVENLVIEMLSVSAFDQQQTFKDLMNRMTGRRLINSVTHERMSAKDMPQELRGISRQSVYKALNFLKDAGILTGKPDQKLNRKTVKTTRIAIDVIEARKRYAQLWIQKFLSLERCRNLPDEALGIVLAKLKEKFALMDAVELEESMLLKDFYNKNIGSTESYSVLEYMRIQDIDTVMDYLWLFDEMRN
jgi:DNA-binding PadR family transcriptional regulator